MRERESTKERRGAGAEAEGEGERENFAGSIPSMEPDTGLNLTTLKS